MKLDPVFLVTFLSIFARMTAMLAVAPFTKSGVPIQVRVLFAGLCGLVFSPVVRTYIGGVPDDMAGMLGLVGRDVLIGLLIGSMTQLCATVFEIAGTWLDLQMGISQAQALNPLAGDSGAPVSRLKSMLAVVILFLLNGHHLMFRAFLASYAVSPSSIHLDSAMVTDMMGLIGRMMLLAVQIAAPVAAITTVIDVAAGLLNKAVPQTQPFMLSLPTKLGFGMVGLAVALPGLVVCVQKSVQLTFDALHRMIGV